jgi:hypothetical protein
MNLDLFSFEEAARGPGRQFVDRHACLCHDIIAYGPDYGK